MTSVPRPPSVPRVSPGDARPPVSPCPPSPYRGDTGPGDSQPGSQGNHCPPPPHMLNTHPSHPSGATVPSHVEQAVAARIAAARVKRAKRRQQRAGLAEARAHGLQVRHAAKMRRWAAEEEDE